MSDMHGETVASITAAFARKLTLLNDRHARMGLPVLSLQDPLDILSHIDGLATGMQYLTARELSEDIVDALGAQCIALRLALARVEALDVTSGDDAA
jgi:hypothetical protein